MSEILEKALLSTTGGSALIPEDLNPALIEYLGRYWPLWNMIETRRANGKT